MSCTQEENNFLDMVLNITKVSVYTQEETAMCMMNTLIKLLKSLEDNNQIATFRKKLVGIMEEIREKLPEVYRVTMMKGGQNSKADVFFLPGVEKPSEDQLEVGKIISSSQLIQALSSKILVDVTSAKGVKKIFYPKCDQSDPKTHVTEKAFK